MNNKKHLGFILAGIGAGAINGLFGAGGGMVLVPLLSYLTSLEDTELFPASVSIILPICLVSLVITFSSASISWDAVFPYLSGSTAGGILAGVIGKRIPTIWLHRFLGILILWGGFRYLC